MPRACVLFSAFFFSALRLGGTLDSRQTGLAFLNAPFARVGRHCRGNAVSSFLSECKKQVTPRFAAPSPSEESAEVKPRAEAAPVLMPGESRVIGAMSAEGDRVDVVWGKSKKGDEYVELPMPVGNMTAVERLFLQNFVNSEVKKNPDGLQQRLNLMRDEEDLPEAVKIKLTRSQVFKLKQIMKEKEETDAKKQEGRAGTQIEGLSTRYDEYVYMVDEEYEDDMESWFPDAKRYDTSHISDNLLYNPVEEEARIERDLGRKFKEDANYNLLLKKMLETPDQQLELFTSAHMTDLWGSEFYEYWMEFKVVKRLKVKTRKTMARKCCLVWWHVQRYLSETKDPNECIREHVGPVIGSALVGMGKWPSEAAGLSETQKNAMYKRIRSHVSDFSEPVIDILVAFASQVKLSDEERRRLLPIMSFILRAWAAASVVQTSRKLLLFDDDNEAKRGFASVLPRVFRSLGLAEPEEWALVLGVGLMRKEAEMRARKRDPTFKLKPVAEALPKMQNALFELSQPLKFKYSASGSADRILFVFFDRASRIILDAARDPQSFIKASRAYIRATEKEGVSRQDAMRMLHEAVRRASPERRTKGKSDEQTELEKQADDLMREMETVARESNGDGNN
uniref:Uncharacterized protein n=1 Tax=Chromera velia CCMP2878 TaxID=1169474 RepID=A0A0G4EYP9_9ALVE|eukprot:Cvel_14248.t1-p1 / transcript=Cvel_14248.t1 / gene=Cvel_14248 / organism=Chromera_velia_CCMP2878 / gene_product=hypothetical protein / transcript_product=hypothetical protein / location=Cvel_scaffold1005:47904-51559(-) / protein_length=622 / sequence_SO=supercontig / SO=protein_coding / is_pseudo=false